MSDVIDDVIVGNNFALAANKSVQLHQYILVFHDGQLLRLDTAWGGDHNTHLTPDYSRISNSRVRIVAVLPQKTLNFIAKFPILLSLIFMAFKLLVFLPCGMLILAPL